MTGNRANGNGLWDLEAAAEAAAAEQGLDPFTFAYKGEKYTVPHMKRWPADALTSLREGDLSAALGVVLGDEPTGALFAAGITIGELEALFDKIAAEAGMGGLPNSGPPSRRATTRT